MASAAQIRAGAAYVELGAKDVGLQAQLRSAQRGLENFAASLKRIGAGLLALGGAMAFPLQKAAQAFGDFEFIMSRVKGLLELTGDQEMFPQLEAEARKMGLMGFAATDAANAMVIFAQGNVQAKDILTAIGPVLNMAAAETMDLAHATQTLIEVTKAQNLEMSEIGHVADVMTMAAAKTATSTTQIAEALRYVSLEAHQANMTLEETVAAIAILQAAGKQGSMAGTTFRGAILAITAPTEHARTALKEMGISILDLKGEMRPVADILTDFQEKFSKLGKGARLEELGKIFPRRGGQIGAVAAMIDDLSKAAEKGVSMRDLLKSLKDVEGTGERLRQFRMDTLVGSWLLLKGAITDLGITIGAQIAPLLREVGTLFMSLAGAISRFAQKNPELAQRLMMVTAGITLAGAALLGLGFGLSLIMAMVGGLTIALKGLGAILVFYFTNRLVLAIKWIGPAIYAVIAATDTGRSMMASFLGYFTGVWSTIANGFTEMVETVRVAWKGIQDAIAAGDLAGAGKIAILGLKLEWAKGFGGILSLWTNLQDNMTDIGTRFFQRIINFAAAINVAWLKTTSAMGGYWEETVAGMKNAAIMLSNFLTGQNEAMDDRIEAQRKERAEKLAAGLGAIETTRLGLGAQFGQMGEEEKKKRRNARNADIASAQAEFDAAVADAEFWRRQKDMGPKMDAGRRKTAERLGGGKGVVDLIGAKADVLGTFASAAISGLGSTSVSEAIKKNTAEAVDELKGIRKDMKEAGPKFE